jgi:hypothetical protein
MELKLSYESMADVPAEFKEAFTEQDGKFVISKSIEIKTKADVDEALKSKGHVKTELAELKASYAEKETSMQNELDILRAKAKEGGDDEETINAIVQAKLDRATEQMTAENKTLKEQLEQEQGFRFNTELESNLMKELSDKVDASFTGDSLALLKGNFKREANGEFLTSDGLGIGDAVSKFIEGRPHFAPKNVGGGAQGNTSTAPQDNRAKFNDLLKKQQSGETLNRQDAIELSSLANQIKNEE